MASNKRLFFCGRPESQVGFLIMGIDNVRICNECALQAAEIVKETPFKIQVFTVKEGRYS